MKDDKKTKAHLIGELNDLRQRVRELEKSGTVRPQAEEVEHEKEEKYQALVETTNTGYLILDSEGRVVDANREYVRLSGHKALSEIIGRSVVEWTAEYDRERNAVEVTQCLRRGFVRGLEIDYVDREGRITPIEIQATVIRKGPSLQILSLCRDITERKRTGKDLLRAKEELEWRVKERTLVLQEVNQKLQTELTERQRVEAALRQSQEKLRLLSDQLINAQEKERKRISIELHDDLGQSLVGLKFQLCNLPKKLKPDQKGLKKTIEEALKNLDGMTEKVRRLSRDLRPAILEHLGLFEALQWLMEDSSKNYRFKIYSDFKKSPYSFSKKKEVNIFRIFQEALTNIGKHAGAGRVHIGMTENEHEAVFSIEDDGKGFDPEGIKSRKPSELGLGLTAMGERTRLTGGALDIKSAVGRGTVITFTIPKGKKRKGSTPPTP